MVVVGGKWMRTPFWVIDRSDSYRDDMRDGDG